MSDKQITHLLIDTSYLRAVGFNDPNFRLLLLHSQENMVKIFVSHIAWEERRTQFLDNACSKVRRVQKEFDDLSALLPRNLLLGDLPPPTLNMWSPAEIEARSKEFMTKFAADFKIEVIPVSSHDAGRTWERYFETGLPSTLGEDRKKNRNDIPDIWIFEAAFDKKKKHTDLMALCHDENLSDALKTIDIRVFKKTQDVLDEIENSLNPKPVIKAVTNQDAISLSIQENAMGTVPETELDGVLAGAREKFKDLESKILGYVGYLGAPSKDQLFTLLSKSGISVETATNVAERLVIAGIMTDTGNHYISRNKGVSDLAATLIEPEIIQLLEEI